MEHMIDEGGVALREKKVRPREARLTLINGLCLYIWKNTQKMWKDAYLSLHFSFLPIVIGAGVRLS